MTMLSKYILNNNTNIYIYIYIYIYIGNALVTMFIVTFKVFRVITMLKHKHDLAALNIEKHLSSKVWDELEILLS